MNDETLRDKLKVENGITGEESSVVWTCLRWHWLWLYSIHNTTHVPQSSLVLIVSSVMKVFPLQASVFIKCSLFHAYSSFSLGIISLMLPPQGSVGLHVFRAAQWSFTFPLHQGGRGLFTTSPVDPRALRNSFSCGSAAVLVSTGVNADEGGLWVGDQYNTTANEEGDVGLVQWNSCSTGLIADLLFTTCGGLLTSQKLWRADVFLPVTLEVWLLVQH